MARQPVGEKEQACGHKEQGNELGCAQQTDRAAAAVVANKLDGEAERGIEYEEKSHGYISCSRFSRNADRGVLYRLRRQTG